MILLVGISPEKLDTHQISTIKNGHFYFMFTRSELEIKTMRELRSRQVTQDTKQGTSLL